MKKRPPAELLIAAVGDFAGPESETRGGGRVGQARRSRLGPTCRRAGASDIDASAAIVMMPGSSIRTTPVRRPCCAAFSPRDSDHDGSGTRPEAEHLLRVHSPQIPRCRPSDVYINELFGALASSTRRHGVHRLSQSPTRRRSTPDPPSRPCSFGASFGVLGFSRCGPPGQPPAQLCLSQDAFPHLHSTVLLDRPARHEIWAASFTWGDGPTITPGRSGCQLGLQIAAAHPSAVSGYVDLGRHSAQARRRQAMTSGSAAIYSSHDGMSDLGWQGGQDAGARSRSLSRSK